MSGVSLALHFVFWMRSLFIIPVYISTLLVAVYPFYSLLIEVIAYRRRLPLMQFVGFLACTLLLAMYLGVHELVFNVGVIEAMVAGFMVAVYFEVGSYARYKLKEPTTKYAISTYLVAALFVALFAGMLGVSLLYYEPVKYVFFVALAVVPMILGHTLINYMLGKYPASIATSIGYGEPFGAGLLAYLLLKQEISPTHIVFGILIIVTVFITVTTLYEE
ncbi:MAG: DMT family transporter [Desulfurococcaceae archaeon]